MTASILSRLFHVESSASQCANTIVHGGFVFRIKKIRRWIWLFTVAVFGGDKTQDSAFTPSIRSTHGARVVSLHTVSCQNSVCVEPNQSLILLVTKSTTSRNKVYFFPK